LTKVVIVFAPLEGGCPQGARVTKGKFDFDLAKPIKNLKIMRK
jgi:hypothetical protein